MVRRLSEQDGTMDMHMVPTEYLLSVKVEFEDNDQSGVSTWRKLLGEIRAVDRIRVNWDGLSQGHIFDLGMAFALAKQIRSIKLPLVTNKPSFQNFVFQQYSVV